VTNQPKIASVGPKATTLVDEIQSSTPHEEGKFIDATSQNTPHQKPLSIGLSPLLTQLVRPFLADRPRESSSSQGNSTVPTLGESTLDTAHPLRRRALHWIIENPRHSRWRPRPFSIWTKAEGFTPMGHHLLSGGVCIGGSLFYAIMVVPFTPQMLEKLAFEGAKFGQSLLPRL
jgi:hypothetical protein